MHNDRPAPCGCIAGDSQVVVVGKNLSVEVPTLPCFPMPLEVADCDSKPVWVPPNTLMLPAEKWLLLDRVATDA